MRANVPYALKSTVNFVAGRVASCYVVDPIVQRVIGGPRLADAK